MATGASSSLRSGGSILLLAILLINAAAAGYNCPRDCECTDATIVCTDVTGLRTLDKTAPVQRLVLAGLALTKVPTPLENIRNITELDLSNNRLAEVNHLGKRIRRLDLSQNRITSGKLAKLPQFVESLNLTHNDITYLPLHLMKLKKLRYIELAHNPINCTCETLHIRNWLTSRHVWSDQHVKCAAPHEFKGRPWLQVKQSDVCHPSVAEERKGGYNWEDYEDENDLMLGDQALIDEEEEDDDFQKEYFPVGEKVKRNEPPIEVANDDGEGVDGDGSGDHVAASAIGEDERRKAIDVSPDEGSGDDPVGVRKLNLAADGDANDADEDEDGSGSGGGAFFGINEIDIDFSSTASPVVVDESSEKDEEPLPVPGIKGLGIFRTDLEETTTAAMDPSVEDAVVRVHASNAEVKELPASKADGEGDAAGAVNDPNDAQTGTTDSELDNQRTYILLAILGIILVSLIILVICKRKPDDRNRRGKFDVENAHGREMKEINKNLLDKPASEKNGHNLPERIPLMNADRDKADYDKVFGGNPRNSYSPAKPERTSQPLETFKPVPADRNKSKESLYENVPSNNNNNTVPLQNGTGPPVQNGELHPVPLNDTTDDGGPPSGNHLLAEPVDSPRSKRYSPIYVPTSPKSDRYSPVYSPETGRVKIKLTETPKPKTPILVTRSRSRAGDIVTTMDDDQKF